MSDHQKKARKGRKPRNGANANRTDRHESELTRLSNRIDNIQLEVNKLKNSGEGRRKRRTDRKEEAHHKNMPRNCQLRCKSYLNPRTGGGDPVVVSSLTVKGIAGGLDLRLTQGSQMSFKTKFAASAGADGEIAVVVRLAAVGWYDVPCVLFTNGASGTVRAQANTLPTLAGAGQGTMALGTAEPLRGVPTVRGTRMAYLKDLRLVMQNNQVSNLNMAGGILCGVIPAGVAPTASGWGTVRTWPGIHTFNPKHDSDYPIVRCPVGGKYVNDLQVGDAGSTYNSSSPMGYFVFYAKGVTPGESFDFKAEGCIHYFGKDITANGVEVVENVESISCLANSATSMTGLGNVSAKDEQGSLAKDLPSVAWSFLSDNLPMPPLVRDIVKKTGETIIQRWNAEEDE